MVIAGTLEAGNIDFSFSLPISLSLFAFLVYLSPSVPPAPVGSLSCCPEIMTAIHIGFLYSLKVTRAKHWKAGCIQW